MAKANGKVKLNEEYYLRFGTNAMVEFEEEAGDNFMKVAANMEQGNVSFKMLRTLVWAGLLDCDEEITPKQAGAVIDEVGFSVVVEKVGEAIKSAFPSADEGKPKAVKKAANQ